MPVRDHTVRINGLGLHCREIGDPVAPTLFFLHGIMGHAREWDGLVTALASDFRVLAVDQRGHGESEWPTSTPSSRWPTTSRHSSTTSAIERGTATAAGRWSTARFQGMRAVS